jgi:adenylosuccinate synthase
MDIDRLIPISNRTPRSRAVVGLQWGDEGKGKIIDLLASQFDATVRYNGGANAGHSVVLKGVRYAMHLLPSSVLHPGRLAVIGNGVVVDPFALLREMDDFADKGIDLGGLRISSRAHLVLGYHKAEDEARERLAGAASGDGRSAIGTTRRGIGPAYADKATRSTSVRVGDLLRPADLLAKLEAIVAHREPVLRALGWAGDALDARAIAEELVRITPRLRPHITDTTYLLHDLIADGKRLLFEGANATLLDVDHGTYPFVTSSVCSALGIPAGTGVPAVELGGVIGVCKAYCTRVGGGPFPTELRDAIGDRIRERGREYGTTTGRPRRCGWLDLVALRYAVMINGVSCVAMTLLDVLAGFDELRVCVGYETPDGQTDRFLPDACELAAATPMYRSLPGFDEDISGCSRWDQLPANAQRYVDFIESFIGAKIALIGVGPDRAQVIER